MRASSSNFQRPYYLIIALFLAGLGVRLFLCDLSTRWGYFQDHFDFIGMGITAREHGLFSIYTVPVEDNPVVHGRIYQSDKGEYYGLDYPVPLVANYPPLGAGLFWIQTELLSIVQPKPYANTYLSRVIMSSTAILAEIILVFGVFFVARHLFGRKTALIAGAVCWLFPPLALNSSFFGQTDAWPLAAGVFALYFMLNNRWGSAGFAIGIACMLKPQGILFIPAALFAVLVIPCSQERLSMISVLKRLTSVGLSALATLSLIALPWTMTDGLAWLREAFLHNVDKYPFTTARALNFWYLDLLHLDAAPSFTDVDAGAKILGLSKNSWGALASLTMVGLLAAACRRLFRNAPTVAVVAFTGFYLWTLFIMLTQVHDRYIVYCMPFILIAALKYYRLLPALLLLALVGIAEHTWEVWLPGPAAGTFKKEIVEMYHQDFIAQYERQQHSDRPFKTGPPSFDQSVSIYRSGYEEARHIYRPREYIATILSILAYTIALAGLFTVRPGLVDHEGNLHKTSS